MDATITRIARTEGFGRDAADEARVRMTEAEGWPLILCSWERVLMVHYAIDPAVLAPHVPFELDLHDGKAYVSLVMFEMSGMRTGKFAGMLENLRLFPRHRFLNLRTYVRHGDERGICFLAEWVSNRLAVILGPALYGLPYRNATLDYRHGDIKSLRGSVAGDGSVAYAGHADSPHFAECDDDSLDRFLMERYVGFTSRDGARRRFLVAHEPWPATRATVTLTDDSLLRRAAPWLGMARYSHANYSPGVFDVWIGEPTRLPDRRPTPGDSGDVLIAAPLRVPGALTWLPLIVLLASAFALRPRLAPWVFMWTTAFALFFGCKLRTLVSVPNELRFTPRLFAYLFAWVGMDAKAFLDRTKHVAPPRLTDYLPPLVKTACGASLLLLNAAPALFPHHPYAATWLAMVGLILTLHFGLFHLLALAWRAVGIDATPVMNRPARSTSLAEFWGKRWNAGFRDLTHAYAFRPLTRRLGIPAATMISFFVSGLIHDLVISLPASAGFGLPTLYFTLQGAAVLFERSSLGKRLGLAHGRPGWLFVLFITAAPAYFLFHPPFVERVAMPMFRALGVF